MEGARDRAGQEELCRLVGLWQVQGAQCRDHHLLWLGVRHQGSGVVELITIIGKYRYLIIKNSDAYSRYHPIATDSASIISKSRQTRVWPQAKTHKKNFNLSLSTSHLSPSFFIMHSLNFTVLYSSFLITLGHHTHRWPGMSWPHLVIANSRQESPPRLPSTTHRQVYILAMSPCEPQRLKKKVCFLGIQQPRLPCHD